MKVGALMPNSDCYTDSYHTLHYGERCEFCSTPESADFAAEGGTFVRDYGGEDVREKYRILDLPDRWRRDPIECPKVPPEGQIYVSVGVGYGYWSMNVELRNLQIPAGIFDTPDTAPQYHQSRSTVITGSAPRFRAWTMSGSRFTRTPGADMVWRIRHPVLKGACISGMWELMKHISDVIADGGGVRPQIVTHYWADYT